ncbi:hypothetical protein COL72_24575 [Bacillus toyonensis]|nr:hypothetical protein COL72_24575 [Bacillus toyonensis]
MINCKLIDSFIAANDNYVNKLSIWTAYCIFCLACFFSRNVGGSPTSILAFKLFLIYYIYMVI